MLDLCEREAVDLLFCPANIVPMRNPKIPLVVMLQNIAPFYPRVRRMLAHFEGKAAAMRQLLLEFLSVTAVRKSDLVLFLSEASRGVVERREGHLRAEVIPHGRSIQFHPANKLPDEAPHGPFFLFVSNLYVYKGLEILVDALALAPELPPVAIIGHPFNSGYFAWIQKKIEEKCLGKRISFHKAVPNSELPGWYSNAIALVFPSWCESFGMTPLEAMACGCPVVALRAGPVPEVCGDAAWYAEAPTGHSLMAAMQKAAEHGNDRHYRLRAVKRAGRFSWEDTMRKHLQAFQGVLAD